MADVFSLYDARNLLRDKFVLMFGDSNMRSIYKDLLFLMVEGSIAPADVFRRGGRRASYLGDVLVDASQKDTAGRDFFEIREYQNEVRVRYNFITRVYSARVKKELRAIEEGTLPVPDVVLLNSCLWDITRWGANKEEQYKKEVVQLLHELHCLLPPPRTLIIWTTTMPVATERVKGGVFIKQLEFMKHSMRFMILEANKFAEQVCKYFDVNVLDLHYYMRFQLHRRTNDGLHWEPPAIRHIINIILTHIALSWEEPLPGNFIGESLRMAQAEAESASMDNKEEILLDQDILTYIQNVKKNGSHGKEKSATKRENSETKGKKNHPLRWESKKHVSVLGETRGKSGSTHRCRAAPSDMRKVVTTHSDGNFSITVQQRFSQNQSGCTRPPHEQGGAQTRGRGDEGMERSQPSAYRPTAARNVVTQYNMEQMNNDILSQQRYSNHQGNNMLLQEQYSRQQNSFVTRSQSNYGRQFDWSERYSFEPIPFWQDYPVNNFPWNTSNHQS
ncbi:hypothetical protein Pcinc_034754 [Petrolisthes cinctipes]|uniref:Uncharacterized protein n=1 Tax=Petrolisthes cinctipes TaxID=88211 RepID=A0AAE1BY40_PETCI|nr:hypothetical protein Pcinc_034754 [Petrolisthes cinctipes]